MTKALVILTCLDVLGFGFVALWMFGVFGFRDEFQYWYVTFMILHGVVLLVSFRHLRGRSGLAETGRHRWEIALFMAAPFAQVLYLAWFRRNAIGG